MRFSVATEDRLDGPPDGAGDDGRSHYMRWKTRHTFNHKNEILFDLTEVHSGLSEAEAAASPVEYEVELEWIGAQPPPLSAPGQPAVAGGMPVAARFPPEFCVKKFLFKVADLIALKRGSSAAQRGGAQQGGYGAQQQSFASQQPYR